MHDEFEMLGNGCCIEFVHPNFLIILTSEQVASVCKNDFATLFDLQAFVFDELVVEDVHHSDFVAEADNQVQATWVERKSMSLEIASEAQL